MSHRYIKIGATSLVLVLAFAGLLWSTLRDGVEYYKHVDEVVPDLSKWTGKPMQLHGYVVPGSIQKRLSKESGRLEYRFKEINCGQEIDVYYAGVVPDTFKDGAEVVVKGELEGGSFHSTEVMAKCPSKYQANTGPTNLCTRAGKAD